MKKEEWKDKFVSVLMSKLEEKGWSICKLARMSGVYERTLYSYTSYKNIPSAINAVKIAYAFGCDVGELIDFGPLDDEL